MSDTNYIKSIYVHHNTSNNKNISEISKKVDTSPYHMTKIRPWHTKEHAVTKPNSIVFILKENGVPFLNDHFTGVFTKGKINSMIEGHYNIIMNALVFIKISLHLAELS